MWASENRITRSGTVLGAPQYVTNKEAFQLVRLDAALQYLGEDYKDSIGADKVFDLLVLENNPLKTNAVELKDIRVLQAIKSGEIVFSH